MGREERKQKIDALLVTLLPDLRRGDPEAAQRFSSSLFYVFLEEADEFSRRKFRDDSVALDVAERAPANVIKHIIENPDKQVDGKWVLRRVEFMVRDRYKPEAKKRQRTVSLDYQSNGESEPVAAMIEDESRLGGTPEKQLEARRAESFHEWIEQQLHQLSDQEREIINLRYLGKKKTSRAQIEQQLGLTCEQVRRLECKALKNLREAYALDQVYAQGRISLFEKTVFERKGFDTMTLPDIASELNKPDSQVRAAYRHAEREIQLFWGGDDDDFDSDFGE